MRRFCGLLAVLLLAACAPEPQPAHPALWRVEGPRGERGWLFGTIHSLHRPARWRSPKVVEALEQSDRIVVEIGNLTDERAMRQAFAGMSQSPGLPPLSARVEPALRPRLAALLKQVGATDASFANVETWAAALSLARAGESGEDTANGIDRAVLSANEGKPVVELEGAIAQFAMFDRLPEKEQRAFLAAVLRDDATVEEDAGLADAWRTGDMHRIEAATHKGLLADPELRAALFTTRNRAWARKLAAMLAHGEHPFVAVGAAHMAGPEGLPALLEASGYAVSRVQ
jgi:uncharacterized protein YbaP (TraB family)